MRQQINLYQAIFHRPKDYLSLRNVFLINILVVSLFMALYASAYFERQDVRAKVKAMQAQRQQDEARLQEVRQLFPEKTQVVELEENIAKLQDELDGKKAFLQTLQGRSSPYRQGFSPYFVGLGQAIVDGVWLEQFEFVDGGDSVSLLGKSVNPDYVFRFVTQLSQEPVFKGIHFNTINLAETQATQSSGTLSFLISTEELSGADSSGGVDGADVGINKKIFTDYQQNISADDE